MSERSIGKRLRDAAQSVKDAETERQAAIVAAWEAGWNLSEIAEDVGLSHVTVGDRLDKAGVRRRLSAQELAALRRERHSL